MSERLRRRGEPDPTPAGAIMSRRGRTLIVAPVDPEEHDEPDRIPRDQPHETYLEVWRALEAEDAKIARMFDGLRRSNALQKIAGMVRLALLTPEEAAVTADTRGRVEELAGANNALHPTAARRKRAPAGER